MAARTKSKVTPKYKTKYRVKNWATYAAGLRKRGHVTLWFDEDAIDSWNAPMSGGPGRQHRYSDLAIATALTLRTVFHLPFRQTEGFVLASELTDSSADDASVGAAMIEGIEAAIARFTADGAYDTMAIYGALAAAGTPEPTIVIPPRRTASPSVSRQDVLKQRDVAIARIAGVGRRQWRKEAGAHQQARAENGMLRYKRIIGDALRARKPHAQKKEAMIAVNVINRMTVLGMPQSVAVAA